MQGTNRSGEGGEERACYVTRPGSELRLLYEGERKKKGERNKWDPQKNKNALAKMYRGTYGFGVHRVLITMVPCQFFLSQAPLCSEI